MLVSQAKGRELVLHGVVLYQQDATDQEGSLEETLIKIIFLPIDLT